MVVRWKKRIRCHPEPFACHLRLLESDGPIRTGPEIRPEPFVCHLRLLESDGPIRTGPEIRPEPFVCHPERSEGSFSFDSE